jgi:WD40 repeat protein
VRPDWPTRPPWLIRVFDGEKNTVGGGVYVGDGVVLTAAHVVTAALGGDEARRRAERAAAAAGGQLAVRVAFVNTARRDELHAEVELAYWAGLSEDPGGDRAVLRLAEVPVDAVPAPLRRLASTWDHDVEVYGFPADNQNGVWARGRLLGGRGEGGGLVQIEGETSTGEAIRGGFSGCPVWDRRVEAVVGLAMTMQSEPKKIASMLPVEGWERTWPDLSAKVRWRLDMEPDFESRWLKLARGPGGVPGAPPDAAENAFVGRARVLADLAAWLAPLDPAAAGSSGARTLVRVVAGRPGAGKSAVLARLVWLADPLAGPTSDRSIGPPPERYERDLGERLRGCVDVAINADGKRVGHVIARIAAAAGVDTATDVDAEAMSQELLVAELGKRTTPFTVVADGIELADPHHVGKICRLLRELAGIAQGAGVRVLVGVRTDGRDPNSSQPFIGAARRPPEAPAAAGPAAAGAGGGAPGLLGPVVAYQLDDAYADHAGMLTYVKRRLRASRDGTWQRYRANRRYLDLVANAVVDKAAGMYLLAVITCDALVNSPPVDVAAADWRRELPGELGRAVERYLDAYGDRWGRDKAVQLGDVLTALAFGRGDGFAADGLCAAVATALGRGEYDARAVQEVTEVAADYLDIRTSGPGTPSSNFRLFHQEVRRYLRDRAPGPDPQGRIVDVIVERVPVSGGSRDWAQADPYTLRHLAGHAEAAGRRLDPAGRPVDVLADLLDDACFLAAADPQGLVGRVYRLDRLAPLAQIYLSAFHRTRDVGEAPAGAAPARMHRWLRSADPAQRAAYLRLHALAYDREDEAAAFEGLIPAAAPAARWARLRLAPPHLVLAGHAGTVRAAAVAEVAGRPTVATADDDGTVLVWDLASGDLLHTLGGPGPAVLTVSGVPATDGLGPRYLTGAEDGRLRLWDAADGQLLATFTGHVDAGGRPLGAVTQLAVIPVAGDPVAVSVAHDDPFPRLWNLRAQAGAGLLTVDGPRPPGGAADAPSFPRVAAVLLPDGTPVALTSGGPDTAVHVWDLATGRHLAGLVGHQGPVSAITVASWTGGHGLAAGQQVAVTAAADDTVRVWELPDGLPVLELHGPQGAAGWSGSPSGVALAVGELGDRLRAAAGGADGWVHVWDLRGRQLMRRQPDRAGGWVGTVLLTVHGTVEIRRPLLTVAGQDETVQMWQVGDRGVQARPALTGHGGPVHAALIAEVGRHRVAVTSGEDRLVRLWHLGGDGPLTAHPGHGEASALAVDEDGERAVVVTGGVDGTTRAWDLADGQPGQVFGGAGGRPVPVQAVAVARAGGRRLVLSAGDDRQVLVHDLDTAERVAALAGPEREDYDWKWGLVIRERAGRGPAAVVAGSAGLARAWDLATGAALGARTAGGVPLNDLRAVVGRPAQVVLGGEDGSVWLWDLDAAAEGVPAGAPAEAGGAAVPLLGPAVARGVRAGHVVTAAAVTGGRLAVVAGYEDGAVTLSFPPADTDLADGDPDEPVDHLDAHHGAVRAAAIVPEPAVAITVGDDGRVLVWNLADLDDDAYEFPGHPAPVSGLAVTTVGARPVVVTGDTDGLLRAWDLGTRREVASAALTGAVTALAPVAGGVVAATTAGHVLLGLGR